MDGIISHFARHLTDNNDYNCALATIVEVYSCHDMTSAVLKRKKVHYNHGLLWLLLVVGAPTKITTKKKRVLKKKKPKPKPPPLAPSPAKKNQKKDNAH